MRWLQHTRPRWWKGLLSFAFYNSKTLGTYQGIGMSPMYSFYLPCVTPSFKGKTKCIDHVCARIKLHTRLDIMNAKNSATRLKSYYKP
jgi:hypothetical protein